MALHTCQPNPAVVSKQRDSSYNVHGIPLDHEEDELCVLRNESRNDSEGDLSEDLSFRESDEDAQDKTMKAGVPIKHIKIRSPANTFECPTYVSIDSTEDTSTSSSSQTDCTLKFEKSPPSEDAAYSQALEREKARNLAIVKGDTKINHDDLILSAWESCIPLIHNSKFTRSDLLYFKAIESERKKVALREAASKTIKPKLNLEARESRSAQKARSMTTPCHIRLYKLASKTRTLDKVQEEKISRATTDDNRAELASTRLYNDSIPLQEDGRKRRLVVAEAIAKSREPFAHPTTKLPLRMADNMYYRGISYLLYVEQKKVESAAKRNAIYSPSIVPQV